MSTDAEEAATTATDRCFGRDLGDVQEMHSTDRASALTEVGTHPRPHVLVTGGAGFIGRHAVAALCEAKARVTAIGRRERPAELDRRADYRVCEILNPAAIGELFASCDPFDIVLHLAWETRHGHFWTAPENRDWIDASNRLLETFASRDGRRFVGAGTCVEYGAPAEGPCTPGITPIAPTHVYGIAKDQFRSSMAKFCAERNIAHAWGRAFLVIGVGEHPDRLVPSVIRSIIAGKPARCSSGRQIRDFMDVRDCGAAFAALVLSDANGAFNVSSGEPRTIGEVVTMLAALLGKPELVQLGALPDRAGEPPNLWGTSDGLRHATGFVSRYRLAESLTEALAYWQGYVQEHRRVGFST